MRQDLAEFAVTAWCRAYCETTRREKFARPRAFMTACPSHSSMSGLNVPSWCFSASFDPRVRPGRVRHRRRKRRGHLAERDHEREHEPAWLLDTPNHLWRGGASDPSSSQR